MMAYARVDGQLAVFDCRNMGVGMAQVRVRLQLAALAARGSCVGPAMLLAIDGGKA